jgi:hypothetical protein
MAKKAVLIGINYPGTKAELRGCVNDVWRMHKCLIERYGFSENDVTILIDTDSSYTEPTGKNIRSALSDLVGSAEEGDVLFVHYSGHGTRLPAETGEDDDTGYDECIIPSDMNLITGSYQNKSIFLFFSFLSLFLLIKLLDNLNVIFFYAFGFLRSRFLEIHLEGV